MASNVVCHMAVVCIDATIKIVIVFCLQVQVPLDARRKYTVHTLLLVKMLLLKIISSLENS